MPQYHLAKEDEFKGWDLDKDYYGSNAYGKDTCVFLKHQENTLYSKIRPLKVTEKKTQQVKVFIEIEDASDYLNISKSGLKTALYRRERLTRGVYSNYEFEFIDNNNEEDFLFRYELSRNQINELLNGLIKDPFSRRHMTSFYNWSNMDKKMLVECAFQTQWSVRKVGNEKYLDMTLTMRSSDYLVAGHINKLQYLALQMMIAKHCNYKVGNFAHFVQNLHIYSRHLKQAEILLDRLDLFEKNTRRGLPPTLILDVPDGTNFYEITTDDFKMYNYMPIKPNLKFELGI